MEKVKTCIYCSKNFSGHSNLNRHLRNVHKIEPPKINKSDITCPLCDSLLPTFWYFSLFRKHLKDEHNINIEKEELTFRNRADFAHWKHSIEELSGSSYIIRSSNILLSGVKKIKYICRRSGCYVSKATGIRQTKPEGSCKIGRSCPSTIQTIEIDAQIKVTYFKTHVGHDVKSVFEANNHMEDVIVADIESSTAVNELLELSLGGQQEIIEEKSPLVIKPLKKVKIKTFQCTQCHRVFTSSCFMKMHMIRTHGSINIDTDINKKGIKCGFGEDCLATFRRIVYYQQHLITAHGLKLKKTIKTFNSIDEFLEWKTKEECDLNMEFKEPKNGPTFTKKGNIKKRTFWCCTSDDNPVKDQLNFQNISKCPAKIDLYFSDNRYIVMYLKTHVGHNYLKEEPLISQQQPLEKTATKKLKSTYDLQKVELMQKMEQFKNDLVVDKYNNKFVSQVLNNFDDIFKPDFMEKTTSLESPNIVPNGGERPASQEHLVYDGSNLSLNSSDINLAPPSNVVTLINQIPSAFSTPIQCNNGTNSTFMPIYTQIPTYSGLNSHASLITSVSQPISLFANKILAPLQTAEPIVHSQPLIIVGNQQLNSIINSNINMLPNNIPTPLKTPTTTRFTKNQECEPHFSTLVSDKHVNALTAVGSNDKSLISDSPKTGINITTSPTSQQSYLLINNNLTSLQPHSAANMPVIINSKTLNSVCDLSVSALKNITQPVNVSTVNDTNEPLKDNKPANDNMKISLTDTFKSMNTKELKDLLIHTENLVNNTEASNIISISPVKKSQVKLAMHNKYVNVLIENKDSKVNTCSQICQNSSILPQTVFPTTKISSDFNTSKGTLFGCCKNNKTYSLQKLSNLSKGHSPPTTVSPTIIMIKGIPDTRCSFSK